MTARTFRLTVAYDGTEYAGWQRQPGVPTVQAAIEAALHRIEGRRVVVYGAGRTDAGVHAIGQVGSFQLDHTIPVSALHRALNAMLPSDIRIVDVAEAAARFHAQYCARLKVYRYRIDAGRVAQPMERRYAWHLPDALDDVALRAAGRILVGRHDFAAFQTAGREPAVRSTVRTIEAVRIIRGDPMLTIEVEGDGFLRHMVRTIVGTLVEVGRGHWSAPDMGRILDSRRRAEAGPTAPARGLCLVRVETTDA